MRVELLVVMACPNERPTYERLRQVLDEAGHVDTPIAVRTVTEDTVVRSGVRGLTDGRA